MGAHRVHHIAPSVRDVRRLGQLAERLRPQIRGQHDQRLLEVHHAPVPVGQHAVIEHLQQHIKDIRMRLFDLVKQHHLIGPPPHCLGQHAAFVVSDVSRRCTDQPRDRVLFHELAHIEAHHGVVVVKQKFRHRLGQLGLADPRGTKKQERPKRAMLVVQPRPRPAHRIGHGPHRGFLTNHPATDLGLHPHELFALALKHFRGRNAGPAFHHLGDLLGSHRLFDQHIRLGAFGLGQRLFKVRNDAIGKLARLGQIALAFGQVQFGPGLFKVFFEAPRAFQLVALGLPACGQFG